MNLSELQQLFWRAARGQSPNALVRQHFVERGQLDACERLHIYERMYFVRQHQALVDGFPKLAAALGERFPSLVRRYLRLCPSEHALIERLGSRLPRFLRDAGEPLLADLAELEWARTTIFLAPDAAHRSSATEVNPDWFAQACLKLVPCVTVIVIDSAALLRWAQPQAVEPAGTPCGVVVFRSGYSVLHRRLPEDEALALARAIAGESVAEVCAEFGERDAGDVLERAFQVISQWLDDGWIEAISAPAR